MNFTYPFRKTFYPQTHPKNTKKNLQQRYDLVPWAFGKALGKLFNNNIKNSKRALSETDSYKP